MRQTMLDNCSISWQGYILHRSVNIYRIEIADYVGFQ